MILLDPPNDTNPQVAMEKICNNDKTLKDVNLNNIAGIDEKTFCEIFEGLRHNDSLVRVRLALLSILLKKKKVIKYL